MQATRNPMAETSKPLTYSPGHPRPGLVRDVNPSIEQSTDNCSAIHPKSLKPSASHEQRMLGSRPSVWAPYGDRGGWGGMEKESMRRTDLLPHAGGGQPKPPIRVPSLPGEPGPSARLPESRGEPFIPSIHSIEPVRIPALCHSPHTS